MSGGKALRLKEALSLLPGGEGTSSYSGLWFAALVSCDSAPDDSCGRIEVNKPHSEAAVVKLLVIDADHPQDTRKTVQIGALKKQLVHRAKLSAGQIELLVIAGTCSPATDGFSLVIDGFIASPIPPDFAASGIESLLRVAIEGAQKRSAKLKPMRPLPRML